MFTGNGIFLFVFLNLDFYKLQVLFILHRVRTGHGNLESRGK